MFDAIKKLFVGSAHSGSAERHKIASCPDCGVRSGELHDLFCLKERCPFCDGQLATCDCIRNVLKLSEEEATAVDEYVDDSVPPLSGVMQRWREALDRKGRVPFKSFPDDPIRAANRGDVRAVKEFLHDGFPVNSRNEVGYTMLMGAVRGEAQEVIRLILSRGGKATLSDKRGCTPLHWAVAQPPNDSARQLECVRLLIDAGADVNAIDENGGTPLMNAAWFGCCDSVKELLLSQANSSLRDAKGRTARDLASQQGHTDVVEILQ